MDLPLPNRSPANPMAIPGGEIRGQVHEHQKRRCGFLPIGIKLRICTETPPVETRWLIQKVR